MCVLLGISEETKGYRLYDPKARRIVVSRDVIVDEEKSWEWNEDYQVQINLDLEWNDDADEDSDRDNSRNEDDNSGENADVMNDADVINEGNSRGIESSVDAADEEDADEVHEGGTCTEIGGTSTEISECSNAQNDGRNMRERRLSSTPTWMNDYVAGEGLSEDEAYLTEALAGEDPLFFEEAVKERKWKQAMDEEINSIEKNRTWTLTELPAEARKIGVKWLYKTKYNEHGEIDKHKARLVAKGYSQQYGIDYTEVFAPVARLDTIRMILALTAQNGWKIGQLDVKSAFLHGELSENVYVEQPRGYEQKGKEHLVYKLHKALYGLKQAPRAWFNRIERYFVKEGFMKCENEQTLFTKKSSSGKILIVSIYVDDLLFTGDDKAMLTEFKLSMLKEFDMTDLGSMRYFLGIEVMQREDGIFICQKKYALEILKRFGMMDSNEVSNPMVTGSKVIKDSDGVPVDETHFKQIVGSLIYLTATRPDMMFSTSIISRYMAKPTLQNEC